MKIVEIAEHLGATSFPADPRDEVDSEAESESRVGVAVVDHYDLVKSTFSFPLPLPLLAWYLMKTRLSDSKAESDELNRIVTVYLPASAFAGSNLIFTRS